MALTVTFKDPDEAENVLERFMGEGIIFHRSFPEIQYLLDDAPAELVRLIVTDYAADCQISA